MISRETINLVREKTDIVALIESKGVSLRRSGQGYVGLCPVHNESGPSFHVKTSSQTYRCFGCGVSGDAIALMQELEGFSFTGAVEYLADMAGIVIETTEGADPEFARKKDYLSCVNTAAFWYRENYRKLPEDHAAKQELIKRDLFTSITDENWDESFGLGYAPEGYEKLSTYLISKGFTKEQIIDAGLARASEFNKIGLTDCFRGRLTWEIRNVQGKVIGFGARRLFESDKGPKYLNTSETIMYRKSNVLYGLDVAKKKITTDKTVFVTEGYTDVMALRAVGSDNAVASCGTAFGSEHAAIIRRMIDDFDSARNGKFVFVFDGDAAGVKAALSVFDITPPIHDRAYVVALGEGDPCDIRLSKGDEYLRNLLTKHIPLTEYVIKHKMKSHDLEQIEGRQNFANEALAIIANIPEVAIYESYRRKISFWSGIPLEFLQAGKKISQPQAPVNNMDPFGYDVPEDVPQRQETAAELNERELVATFLQFPEEVYPVLREHSDIVDLYTDEKLRDTLIEVMAIVGYDIQLKNNIHLVPGDFNYENLVTQLFHFPLSTTADRAGDTAGRIVRNLQKLDKKKKNDTLRRRLSQSLGDNSGVDTEILKMFMENRKP